jgi:sigma-B regulation protein RsbU (phosphoserine phosphatase)
MRRFVKNTILDNVPLFASLPRAEVERLSASLPRRDLQPGDILLHEGEPGDHFYLIACGDLEVVKSIGTPDEQLIGISKPGDCIGEMSLLNPDRLRSATARARTAVSVLEMQRADLDALLRRYPQMAYDLARVLSQRLQQTDNTLITELHERNAKLTAALEQLQNAQAQIVQQEKLLYELKLARQIQQSMLPNALPALRGFDFGAHMVPAEAVGGDFYDFIPLDDDSIGIAIGDVSGKGIPAALFMALTCSLLRAGASRDATPAETLRTVNHHLLQMGNGRTFVTVTYGVLCRATGDFVYTRAGHEPLLVVTSDGVATPATPSTGQPLGLLPEPELSERVITLQPGSTLLLYTDGATEAMDARRELFGIERLQQALGAKHAATARESCSRLLQTLVSYRGSMAQADDITLVGVHAQSAQ